jgi:diguanylate cyclase (GGDEF)-like protein
MIYSFLNMKVEITPGHFFDKVSRFVSASFKRAFSSRKAVLIYILLMVIAAVLFTGIVSDIVTRPYRIAFSGSVFALCLISCIVYGIPAAMLTVIVNLLGASFTLKYFHTTADWYYLSIAVFQLTTAISSVIIAVLADTEKSKKETHKEASLTDALTEVYNTRFFHLRLDEELTRSARKADPLTLMLIDVNAFKAINDNFGHAEGDRVLKDIAAHLLKSTRASDVVCRSGGDEFAVILPDTSRDTGIMIANRISSGIPEYIMTSPKNGLSTPVYLSIGLATFPVDTDDRDGLIEYADKALYRDKDEFYASREREEQTGKQ